MAQLLVQHRRFIQFKKRAVDLDALKPLFAQVDEVLAIFAFAVADDRGQQIGAGAILHCHHPVDHVLHLLRLDRQTGGGAERGSGAGEQQAHVVVDFGDGADCGTRVFRGGFLFDGNGRTEARDMIDIGLLHHVEKLPRIGAERFHIAPLPLGIDRIEGQRRFARPRQAGNHHQPVARNVHIDILEVMFARPAHLDELLLCHDPPRLRFQR